MDTWAHTAVLLDEAVDALAIDPQACYVDATFGRGGHSRRILQRLGAKGRLLAFDKDPEALAAASLIKDGRFAIRHQSFALLGELPEGSASGVLMDLGISSPQIDNPERGFSFRGDGPLDMRMDPTRGISAAEWLAEAGVEQIAEVIRDYGEERFARPIAKAIVARRQAGQPVAGTFELAELVAGAVKTREPGKNPATRTFQAIRIFINAELEELGQALEASLHVLQPGGRLVVISFHSLEDRMVKQFMVRHSRATVDRRVPFAEPAPTLLRAVKRVRPSEQEVAANPRARSAIMRVAERTEAPAGAAADERRRAAPRRESFRGEQDAARSEEAWANRSSAGPLPSWTSPLGGQRNMRSSGAWGPIPSSAGPLPSWTSPLGGQRNMRSSGAWGGKNPS